MVMNEETQQDGSQYIEGAFVAFSALGAEIAVLRNEVERLTHDIELANRMWKQQNQFAQGKMQAYEALQQQYEAVCDERHEMELRLKMMVGEYNVRSAWDAAQGMLARSGVWQLWRSNDTSTWFVSSTLTRHVGTGKTLCDAIADLDDSIPEVPA